MTGTIIQVSISRGGIPKRPIREGMLGPLGIEGDMCAHPQIHGGPRQAVLLVSAEVLDDLRSRGFPVYPGALGENLTISGLDVRRMRFGQRYRVGQAMIELTKMRGPCRTLDVYNVNGLVIQDAIYDKQVRAGDVSSPRWGMSGFYASVASPGAIRSGDIIALVDQAV